ncbi:MAG TPA: DEAD/DEAH box helicase family protein [Egibacteraceae bacterium]|nr:DEAD/DEAH box helicase family protein [Egibacteraceae bacterium]
MASEEQDGFDGMPQRPVDGHGELAAARREVEALRAENDRLRALLGLGGERLADVHREAWAPQLLNQDQPLPSVDADSPPDVKVALYRALFVGRDDVYATRWENASSGRSGWSPAVRGGWGTARRAHPDYLPFTDEVAAAHLSGHVTAGLYVLMPGDVCQVLACDFDDGAWALDALAYLEACRSAGVPAALERSRSGDGAHVWTFFSEPLAASTARSIGAALLRETMAARVEVDLQSYDRLFPTQDFLPKAGFGNLIALPLQGGCRKAGTTEFLDPGTLKQWDDQWAFLASVARLSPDAAKAIAQSLRSVEVGPTAARFRRSARSTQSAPEVVRARLGEAVSIERIGLPPSLVASLKHLASLHNPEYYEKERLRFSTFRTPRFVRCYWEDLERLHLPRGLLPQCEQIVREAGSRRQISDDRPEPAGVELEFRSVLSAQQEQAVNELARHELGVLVAPPGEGKTVMACALIARHRVPTLVLVDRKPLAEQWRQRLHEHLGLDHRELGQVGGGRSRLRGVVDVATIQTLARRDVEANAELFAGYGLVVVDECHHVPAVTFDRCLRSASTRRWLGLTATPYRRQGLEEIIEMHCGPVRHTITVAGSTSTALLRRDLIVHETRSEVAESQSAHIQGVFAALAEDVDRTRGVCDDILDAVRRGRNCVVLTRWVSHVESLCDGLRARGLDPLVLHGRLGHKQRAATIARLTDRAAGDPILLVATASFVGEGFDCPPLDTVFLAFPLAWKGSVVQYVGRVMRASEGKQNVEVHDYIDVRIPVIRKMHEKRLVGYNLLGFDVPRSRRGASQRAARA